MKTKNENDTDKTVLYQLRAIREKLSLEIAGKNAEELKGFFKMKQFLHPASPWKQEG